MDNVKLKKVVDEMVNALVRMAGENDFFNEAAKAAAEEHDLKPATIKQMAKIRFKNSLDEDKAKANEIFELYETIFG